MKRILILCLLTAFNCSSQEKINLFFGLKHNFSKQIRSEDNPQFYGESNLQIGIQLKESWGAIDFNCNYLYSVSYAGEPSYSLQSHFLGGNINIHFLSDEKRIRPFFSISGLTEISTNYKNGYLWPYDYDWTTMEKPLSKDGGGPITLDYYYSSFYYATPFVGNIFIGGELKLMRNFYLSLGVGYGLRVMRAKYAEWGENDDVNEILRSITPEAHLFQFFDVQFGLTYVIPFKKEKPQP